MAKKYWPGFGTKYTHHCHKDVYGKISVEEEEKVVLEIKKIPKVFILPEAKKKLDLFIELARGEISGLGDVVQINEYDFLIEDLFILDQECTGSKTKLDQEKIGQMITQLVVMGKDTAKTKLWWHSHVNMGVFWSVTDDDTAAEFNNGWMLCLVGDKKGNTLVRLDIFKPFHITIDNLPLIVKLGDDEVLKEEIKKEIKEKVDHSDYVVTGHTEDEYVYSANYDRMPARHTWPWSKKEKTHKKKKKK